MTAACVLHGLAGNGKPHDGCVHCELARLKSEATTTYRAGFADALRWMLEVFNLDFEDEMELNRVLEGGDCEGIRV